MTSLTLLCLAGIVLQSPAAVFLSGAGSAEEMDSETVELFERLSRHPVQLNNASRSTLLSSGLFSPFQLASLLEYRQSSGDILSFAELSRLDGWGSEFAQALREFVSLESSSVPGQSSSHRSFHADCSLRYGSNGYQAKADLEFSGRCEIFASSSSRRPYNASIALNERRGRGKLVLGAYNARFGQGLAKWSGMTMSGFGSVEALSRRASGISLSESASPSDAGIAADYSFGAWTLSACSSLKSSAERMSLLGSVNLCRLGRSSQWGMTAEFRPGEVTAASDFRCRLGRADLYGEVAWEFATAAPALLLGIRLDPEYQVCWGVLARYYSPRFKGESAAAPRSSTKSSDEAGVSAAARVKWAQASLDCAWHPAKHSLHSKLLVDLKPVFKSGALSLRPSLRLAERFRPSDSDPWHSDLRADLSLTLGPWSAAARWNGVWCSGFGWLSYLEGSYSSERLGVWLRGSLFRIDDWDDRIYCYERDLAGCFNVPAYYGRGVSTSLVVKCKLGLDKRLRHSLGLRAAATFYPWMDNGKPSKYEWRLQYVCSW